MKKGICLLLFYFSMTSVSWGVDVPEDYANEAKVAYQKGDMAQASKYFDQATQADPNNAELFQNLGYCRYQSGQYAEALAAYQKALALKPSDSLKAFVEQLKAKVETEALPALPTVTQGNSNSNEPPIPAEDAKTLLDQIQAAQHQEADGRKKLQLYGQTHTLTEDQIYQAKWGANSDDYRHAHFALGTGLLYVDMGVFIDPTTDLGLDWLYVPSPQGYYNYTYDSSGYETGGNYVSVTNSVLYLAPRIKFYSAPSGLTSYQGFGLDYLGYRNGYDPTESWDIFGVSYLFGFRTLPKDGWTMELGFQLGVGIILGSTETYNDTYNPTTHTDSYSTGSQSYVVPFPFILPEWRFGYTF